MGFKMRKVMAEVIKRTTAKKTFLVLESCGAIKFHLYKINV